MSELQWQRPRTDKNDPGAGGAANYAFGSKNSLRVDAFVREDLQNRVDARRDDHQGPVRCVIRKASLPKKLIAKYFPEQFQGELIESLKQIPNPKERDQRRQKIEELFGSASLPVLIIEDFGTTGLNGPVNRKIPEKVEGEPLYHPTNALTCFLRRNGRSGKTGQSLGGAGLGRHVYYMASEISAKLIYTVPEDLAEFRDGALVSITPEPMFFGQSLQTELERKNGGDEEVLSGYVHLTHPRASNDLAMPFGVHGQGRDVAETARKDFKLLRGPQDPGCSIIIPFPKATVSPELLLETIVSEFALPVLAGELEIEVQGDEVDSESILELSADENVNEANRFLKDVRAASPDCKVTIGPNQLRRELSADVFEGDELQRLADRFQDGELVCVEVLLRFNETSDGWGTLTVAARKLDDGQKGRGVVARQGLAIRDYCGNAFSEPQNSCVLMKSVDALSTLLKRTEPASHRVFEPGEILASECSEPKALIDRVRTLHHNLVAILGGLDREEDDSIFSDLFSSGGGRDSVDPPPSQPDPFVMAMPDNDQSIRLHANPEYEAAAGESWNVLVVLDSIHGSSRARRSFQAGTFDLRSADLRVEGGQASVAAACQLRLTVDNPDAFELVIGPCGFPEWADVRVHAERVSDVEEQA